MLQNAHHVYTKDGRRATFVTELSKDIPARFVWAIGENSAHAELENYYENGRHNSQVASEMDLTTVDYPYVELKFGSALQTLIFNDTLSQAANSIAGK